MEKSLKHLSQWNKAEVWNPIGEFVYMLLNVLPKTEFTNLKQGPINKLSAMALGLIWCDG